MAQISLSADLPSHAIDLSAAFGWSRWLQRWQRLVTWVSPTGRQVVPVGVRRLISLHRKTLRPDSLLRSVGGCFCRSAFCPIFRSHGRRSGSLPQDDSGRCGRTGASNEIWNFGTEAEAAIAKVMRIREQLRPYIMEQYRAASEMGRPVMTPMFFDFWEDSVAATVDDQMMFGPGAFHIIHESRSLLPFSLFSLHHSWTLTICARRSIASLGLWRGSERCDARARGRCAGGRCDGVGRWKHLRSRVRGRRTGRGALGGGEGGDVRATTRVAWGFRRRGRTRRRRRDGDVERRASARGNERLTVICIFVRAQTGRRSRSRDVRSRRNVWMPS